MYARLCCMGLHHMFMSAEQLFNHSWHTLSPASHFGATQVAFFAPRPYWDTRHTNKPISARLTTILTNPLRRPHLRTRERARASWHLSCAPLHTIIRSVLRPHKHAFHCAELWALVERTHRTASTETTFNRNKITDTKNLTWHLAIDDARNNRLYHILTLGSPNPPHRCFCRTLQFPCYIPPNPTELVPRQKSVCETTSRICRG